MRCLIQLRLSPDPRLVVPPLPSRRSSLASAGGNASLPRLHLTFSPPPTPALMDPGEDPHDYVHVSHPSDPAPDPNAPPQPTDLDLPEELARVVTRLECESSADSGRCDVYLVGTAHISQESCQHVQAVISYLKPEVVFLELCSNRIAILQPQSLKVPTVNEMIDIWKKKKMNSFGIIYSWFLARMADRLEVFPGSEFRVAFEEARSYGAKVVLGDRPANITLRRSWGKMSVWHRTKFLYSMLFQGMFLPSPDDINKMLNKMDDADMLTLVIQEMSKDFPTLMETLIHERDLYMSSTLFRVAQKNSSVVAVVGKGHISGIKKNWKQQIEVAGLLEIPKTSSVSRMKVFGVAAAGVALILGLYFVGKR